MFKTSAPGASWKIFHDDVSGRSREVRSLGLNLYLAGTDCDSGRDGILNEANFTMFIKPISFHEHSGTIAMIRREVYTTGLLRVIDEFDEVAHHFALYNKANEIIGVVRALKSTEVPRLELQSESDAQELVYPQDGLIIEVSRGCARKNITGMPLLQMAMTMQKYAREQNASHVVTKSGKRLLPIYQSMGFRVFGKPFFSDYFDDRRTGLMSIPLIYHFPKPKPVVAAVTAPSYFSSGDDEEVLVW